MSPNLLRNRLAVPLLFLWFASSLQASPEGGSTPGSGPAPAVVLPEGVIRLRDGVSYGSYVFARDCIVVQAPGKPNEVRMMPELPNNAALGTYVTGKEATVDPEVIGLIAYPKAFIGDEKAWRLVTRKLAVRLAEGSRDMASAAVVAEEFGLEHLDEEVLESGWTTFAASGVVQAIALAGQVAEHALVDSADPVLGFQISTSRCESDNINLTALFPNDELYATQGYLDPPPDDDNNANWTFVHINVRPVWENSRRLFPHTFGERFLKRPYKGTGVRVAIVDDGLEIDHEDLDRNTHGQPHLDIITGGSDPTAGFHGTWVGGIVAAEGDNRIGITGIAPKANLVGFRWLSGGIIEDSIIKQLFDYKRTLIDVHNNSWGPPEPLPIARGPGPLTLDALDREQKYVFSAGNGGPGADVNYAGYMNHIKTIAVAAINSNAVAASYTTPGAAVLCAGLAADPGFALGTVVSTDRDNEYIDGLAGTSFSAPMVTGVIALMLEARSDLGWRDIQEILITSCGVGQVPGGFIGNGGKPSPTVAADPYLSAELGGGFFWDEFMQTVGFGLVNTAEAVRLAEIWARLPSPAVTVTQKMFVNDDIDGSNEYIFEFSERRNIRVEHATVTLYWDVRDDTAPADVTLVSPTRKWGPGQFESRLSFAAKGTHLPETWTLMSVGHWGQLSAEGFEEGRWKVEVGGAGGRNLDYVELTLHGTPANEVPVILAGDIVTSSEPTVLNPRMTTSDQSLMLTNVVLRDTDFDDPTVNFQWQALHPDGVTWQDVPGAAGAVLDASCDWLPVPNFTFDPLTPRMNESVQFTDQSTDVGGTIVSWFWDFGDGTTSILQNPTHTYTDVTDRTVTLTITDDTGNVADFSIVVVVLGLTENPPDPLPVIPVNDGSGVCFFSGTVILPARATSAGTIYRVVLRAQDYIQEGPEFTSEEVIVNSTPELIACRDELYTYDANLWIDTIPPEDYPPFVLVNEFSQGTLGNKVNSEWVELLVAVGVDLRGYHITNEIATFDLILSQSDVWSAIPPGTLIVIYNGDYRDAVLPPDDSNPSDGVLVVSSNNASLIELPSNGDAWGEFSNSNPSYLGVLSKYCRDVHGISFNEDSTYTTVGDLPDGKSASSLASDIDGYADAGNWFVESASALPPGTPLPVAPGTVGVTPGFANNTNNVAVVAAVVAADRTSVSTFSLLAPFPAWLSINPTTGVLSGTPSAADVGVSSDITIEYSHSFSTERQSFTINVKAGPPLTPGGDIDKDGIINMLEKAFVTDPYTASSATSPPFGLPGVGSTTVSGPPATDHLSITFRIPDAAVFDAASQTYTWTDANGDVYFYEVQQSTNLVDWATAGSADLLMHSVETASDNADVDLVTFRLIAPMPGTAPLKYLRIRVTYTPGP